MFCKGESPHARSAQTPCRTLINSALFQVRNTTCSGGSEILFQSQINNTFYLNSSNAKTYCYERHHI